MVYHEARVHVYTHDACVYVYTHDACVYMCIHTIKIIYVTANAIVTCDSIFQSFSCKKKTRFHML